MNNGGVNRPKGIFDYSLYMYIPVYEEDIKMGRWYTLCRRLTALAAVFMICLLYTSSAGQIGMTVGGPWVTAGLDTAGVNYGIGLIPQGDAGDMNSVEVLGFSVTTTASDEEKEAAYKFIEWWNSENTEGSRCV